MWDIPYDVHSIPTSAQVVFRYWTTFGNLQMSEPSVTYVSRYLD